MTDQSTTDAAATAAADQTKKARVFLRVKRRRSPVPATQKFAFTTNATDAVDENIAAGTNHGSSRDKRKSKSIAPECIKLALPAFDPAEVDTKRSKRRRMSPSMFDNKEGSAFLQRLSSVNLDHCKKDCKKDGEEKGNNPALLFTPSRAQRGGGQRSGNPLEFSDGGDDEQRTPPSYSFDTTKDCHYSNDDDEEDIAAEPQSQAPVKPKRTVIFRKITDIRKCLDKQQEQQQLGESPSESTMQAVQDDSKRGDCVAKGDEQAKWLRIVDVRLEADAEDVSSCSDNSGDYNGGTGPRVRRMRTRPSDVEDDGDNNQNRRTKKRRKLGVAVEQSQTVLESAFWGNMNADKFHENDCVLDPEVLRLIDYSLASLHTQNGGTVSPHLSFLRIDPRLGFVAKTPHGNQMINRQYHGTGNGIADGRGRTVLHMAALWGDMVGIRAAIDMGADPTIRDGQGLCPAELAKMYGQKDVSSALVVDNTGESESKEENGQGNDDADYYYELYCLEEGDEGAKENIIEEEKKDDDREISSPIGTESPPGLTRANNWDEVEDDYRFELSQGFGAWTKNGELILEASGKTQDEDDAFVQKLYHSQGIDDDESMDNDEHDSNDERYDGNDYPDDDQSFGLGSNYDDYHDADADYYGDGGCSDDSDGDGWKLDFRKRNVQRSVAKLNYDSDEEDDYAGPMYGEMQETMNGGFAYDPEIDGSE
eukprot:CAMPEP_0201725932 /NCGR_PEP_ID=MMETSP0593-20130828/9168_1 /ASSEMBLY_ACC=CAM_ASM_000672 /TAXON_ID=267983 /ORGANISM="Skeletonema japonicum, Strain CCMP2506" /LENGTH=705 /DNA_ID=CAMNT_0048217391 /DNA_START=71 /DNA_END=2188 /DNA_ORIENTATION=-